MSKQKLKKPVMAVQLSLFNPFEHINEFEHKQISKCQVQQPRRRKTQHKPN